MTRQEKECARIRELLARCVDGARSAGWDGDGDYEYTQEDLDWVTCTLGYKPTAQMWSDAGLPYVGGRHCGDEDGADL